MSETLPIGSADQRRHDRISDELMRGYALMQTVPSGGITVLGSARVSRSSAYFRDAVCLGAASARAGRPVITGGGPGIMEAANRGAFEAGGISVGIGIVLPFEDGLNQFLTHKLSLHYLLVRKMLMIKSATTVVAFPGGFGTLEELFEVLTLLQTDRTHKLEVLLYGAEDWRPVVACIESASEAGFVSQQDQELFSCVDSRERLLSYV